MNKKLLTKSSVPYFIIKFPGIIGKDNNIFAKMFLSEIKNDLLNILMTVLIKKRVEMTLGILCGPRKIIRIYSFRKHAVRVRKKCKRKGTR